MGLIMQMKNKHPLDRLLKKLAPKMADKNVQKGWNLLSDRRIPAQYNSFLDDVILWSKGKIH